MKQTKLLLLLGLLLPIWSLAQTPIHYTSSEIHHEIKKFNTLGTVLYIAAHPDDENTRLISWLANHRHAEVTYLSLTRGGGGQNLIGPELGDEMGVIRTQELLGARRIDGGNQFFTRARDFGYSKNPRETFEKWGKEEVLSDVVWAMRKLKPDVVVNRFNHETTRRTHGHHTGSAILGYEAFDLANDPSAFPHHLEYVDPWQPKRLFFNTSWWFYGSRDRFAEADKSGMITADIGVYFPLLGQSNSEIAGRSRSMHKCQGFGAAATRGTQTEYIDYLKGIEVGDDNDIFHGIDVSWNRVDPTGELSELGAQVDREYDHTAPHKSLSLLLEMRDRIIYIENDFWRERKLKAVDHLIRICSGMFLETTADRQYAASGEEVEFTTEVTLRSPIQMKMKGLKYHPAGMDTTFSMSLDYNRAYKFFDQLTIPDDADWTTPYWLNKKGDRNLQQVDDQEMIGKPESPPYLFVEYIMELEGRELRYKKPVIYKYVDPADGENYERFDILPVATVNFQKSTLVFGSDEEREIEVGVQASRDMVKGELKLVLPKGWEAETEAWNFELARKGEVQYFKTRISPPDYSSDETIKLVAEVEGKIYDRSLKVIEYDYIPKLNVLSHAEARAVRVDVKIEGDKIAYIMGSGDDIPRALEQIGYRVEILDPEELLNTNLEEFNAIVTGIRAYNTVDQLKFAQDRLFKYVENGGILIVQYNTGFRLKTDQIAPYPLNISRERVTDHNTEVRFLVPDHEVLNHPNEITEVDFEGWIQERGLYFADEWDDQFTAILGSNDPGEPSSDGGLLIAPHGEGHYVYTGYAWFRQLPAGVPGAYRIFANLLSLGSHDKP